mmetsp:Transcript_53922/g.126009  ORF Transcript_53922/g.126009 Transcript_53922/m.126009 type:complete len:212 (+) Transcript_53922:417-1052(+)
MKHFMLWRSAAACTTCPRSRQKRNFRALVLSRRIQIRSASTRANTRRSRSSRTGMCSSSVVERQRWTSQSAPCSGRRIALASSCGKGSCPSRISWPRRSPWMSSSPTSSSTATSIRGFTSCNCGGNSARLSSAWGFSSSEEAVGASDSGPAGSRRSSGASTLSTKPTARCPTSTKASASRSSNCPRSAARRSRCSPRFGSDSGQVLRGRAS